MVGMVTPRARIRCRSRGCMSMGPHESAHSPWPFGCGTWAYSSARWASMSERRTKERPGREDEGEEGARTVEGLRLAPR
jgi:hypothetical protein